MNVLIAEDEESVRAHIASVLTREGFTCIEAADGLEAVKLFASHHPSLAVLDVMMPRADGYTACELMRNIEPAIPVMFLTAKGDVADRKAGYLAGADDYMAKPFDEEEFVLRVRALLRRSASEQHDSKESTREPSLLKTSDGKDLLKTRSLEIDLRKFELRKHGARIEATPKEFQIVAFLARNANEVFSKEEIVSAVWGNEYGAESVSIPVYVRRIREKIEADPSHPAIIKTIRRVGYVFNLDA